MQTNQIAKALNQDKNNSITQYESSSVLKGEEAKILALHHKSDAFQDIGPKQMFVKANLLIADISLCTGWALPTGEPLKRLVQLFISKINFDYGAYTYEEILYAFFNASHVKNWGASVNLSLFDEVMAPFTHKRAELREQAAKQAVLPQSTAQGEIEFKESPEQIAAKNEETYIFWKFEIENGIKIDYIPSFVYDVVRERDQVRPSTYYMTKALYKAKGLLLGMYAKELNETDKEKQWGRYNELEKLIEEMRGENWQDIDDIQKYGKALWLVDYFTIEPGIDAGILTDLNKPKEKQVQQYSKAGICPLCQQYFEKLPDHYKTAHPADEKGLKAIDKNWIEKNFPYVKK